MDLGLAPSLPSIGSVNLTVASAAINPLAHFERWLDGAISRGIIAVAPQQVPPPPRIRYALLPAFSAHVDVPSADGLAGGMLLDWAALNRCVKPSYVLPPHYWETLRGAVSPGDVVTSISVQAPWEALPLDTAAQERSTFEVTPDGENNTKASSPLTCYRFAKGAPGQRSTRDKASDVLQSIASQLTKQGVRTLVCLSDLIVVCSCFDEALRRTGPVYRAISQAGFAIDGTASCLIPRTTIGVRFNAVVPPSAAGSPPPAASQPSSETRPSQKAWTTLNTATMTNTDDALLFLRDVYVQYACDCYHWGLMDFAEVQELFLAPSLVLSSSRIMPAEDNAEMKRQERALDTCRRLLEGAKSGARSSQRLVSSPVEEAERTCGNPADSIHSGRTNNNDDNDNDRSVPEGRQEAADDLDKEGLVSSLLPVAVAHVEMGELARRVLSFEGGHRPGPRPWSRLELRLFALIALGKLPF